MRFPLTLALSLPTLSFPSYTSRLAMVSIGRYIRNVRAHLPKNDIMASQLTLFPDLCTDPADGADVLPPRDDLVRLVSSPLVRSSNG